MLKEFKEFAMKGNVVDMAIGIIIGVAFGKIISSLVADVLMPPIGMLMGNLDFSNLFFALNSQVYESLQAAKDAGGADDQLRPFHQHGARLRHRGVRHLPARQADEPPQERSPGRRAGDERVSVLFYADCSEGDPVRRLYLRGEGRLSARMCPSF